jgi:hypothetical protein
MFSRRKPLAGLAAVTAALAVALPATSASAAPTVDPTVCQLLDTTTGPSGPTQFAGGDSLANILTSAGASVGCPAPAPQSPLLPSQ